MAPRGQGQRRQNPNGPRNNAAGGNAGNNRTRQNNGPRADGRPAQPRGEGRSDFRTEGRSNGSRRSGGGGGNNAPRQPDPLRTGIDALGERGRHRAVVAVRAAVVRANLLEVAVFDPLRTSFGRIK